MNNSPQPADSADKVPHVPPRDVVLPATNQQSFTYPSGGTIARWVMAALTAYVVGWILWQAGSALLPFIIGLVLAYLLLPIVNWLAQYMRRTFAILLVYVLGIGLLILGFIFVVPLLTNQIELLISSIPTVAESQAMGNRLLERYREILPESVRQPVNDAVASAIGTVKNNAGAYVRGVGVFVADAALRVVSTVTFIIGFLIIPIWLFYVLNDQEQGKAFIDRLLHPRIRADFWNVWRMINQVLTDYIRGQLILGLAVGACVGIGLFALRWFGFEIRYILLLAIVAGITELVPIIGPIIGAVPAVILALFSGGDPLGTTVAVIALYVIIQQLENNFLVPRIVGESVGVHPAILTVALIAFSQVFGLLGVILSAPICAIGRDLYMYAYRRFGGTVPEQAFNSVTADTSEVDTKNAKEPEAAKPVQA